MKSSKVPKSHHAISEDIDCTPPGSPPPTEAQIASFYSLLCDFSETYAVRGQLHILSTSFTGYCPTCTEPGSCGRTCPLLCPPDVYQPRNPHDPKWPRILIRHAALWHALHEEMQSHMATASARQIRMWERTARRLVEESMSELEQKEARGWRTDILNFRIHKGMNGKWSWEKAWRENGEEAVDEASAHDVMEPPGLWRKAERMLHGSEARSATAAVTMNDRILTQQGQSLSTTVRGSKSDTEEAGSEDRIVPVVQVPRRLKRGRMADDSDGTRKRNKYV